MREAITFSSLTGGRAARLSRGSLLVLAAAAGLAGCANRDSITVGSVPDDYRTNHPIVVSEREETLDLPVGVSDHRMTSLHRVAVDGFVAYYDRSAGAPVSIMVPSGSANSAAANSLAYDIAQHLYRKGVPHGRVSTVPYQIGRPDQAPPIRLVYTRLKASTGKCGRWPEDIGDTTENKHWTNFGCASQNNLAAQIANPADLLGPRAPGDIDAENRSNALDQYKAREIAADMRANREVQY